jgi:hypothetical protein
MRPGADDLQSATILQVQAAWLRPNLLRLQHAWLLNVPDYQTDLASSMVDAAQGWALAHRAPSLHPAVVELGVGRPAVAATVKQLGSRQLEELQVRHSCTICHVGLHIPRTAVYMYACARASVAGAGKVANDCDQRVHDDKSHAACCAITAAY